MDYTGMFDTNFFQTVVDSIVSSVGSLFTLELFSTFIPYAIILSFVVLFIFNFMSTGFGIFNFTRGFGLGGGDTADKFIKNNTPWRDKERDAKEKEKDGRVKSLTGDIRRSD